MKKPFDPHYETVTSLYWFLWVFIVLYVIGLIIWLSVFVNNLSPTFTYFRYAGAPGTTLTNYRNTFVSVMVSIAVLSHGLSVACAMLMLVFRTDYGCNILWATIYVFCGLLILLSIAVLGNEYSFCNQVYGNLCNDPRICQVPQIYMDTTFGCSNTLTTTPIALSDLQANSDFLGLFWLNFILFIGMLIFLGVTFYYWTVTPAAAQQHLEQLDEPDESDQPDAPLIPKAPAPTRPHGLVKR